MPTDHDPVGAAVGDVTITPVRPGEFDLVAELFGPNGACSGCWCMWPRLAGRDHRRHSGDGTRAMLATLVDDDRQPGLLARQDGRAIGWVSVAPRPEFGRLLRSPLLRPHLADEGPGAADDHGVWTVACLFVGAPSRGRGLADRLLAAARDHAHAHGAHTVEGLPIHPSPATRPDELFHGTPGGFERAGFTQVARVSPRRSLWRHPAA